MWPFNAGARGGSGIGTWVVTWTGEADIRLGAGAYQAAQSSGAATGMLVDGRRVYVFTSAPSGNDLRVEAVNPVNPPTAIRVWLPDPADRTRSLEGGMWHPQFLAYLRSYPFNALRFMDWGSTNASPQQDWSDRRLPAFRNQDGVLHRRAPASGYGGDRGTGIAYEHMVALCNEVDRDLWICVPHLATDAYVTKLMQLLRYGSDGVEPYTAPQADPVHPPLEAGRRIWLEYSNEIWSSGNAFPQGDWAQAQATALGISKAQFNARRFSQIWRLAQEVLGGTDRLVRTAAIFTANDSYTTPFLTELRDYGPTLTPAVSVDVVAPTTYFGNGIQDWVYEQANATRGTPQQWFHTASDFLAGSVTRPVSVPSADPYWTSRRLRSQQAATFRQWKQRIFSGSAAAGGGPDSTGVGGGFSDSLRTSVATIFGRTVHLVAYEGGPSLYTDYYDGGDVRDDGVTNFMVALNRLPAFAEIYRVQLNMARSKGLSAHSMFVDVGAWGKYGQWGHLETVDQDPATSVKWQTVMAWAADAAALRPVDSPLGTRPAFSTPGTLPLAACGADYSQDLVAGGGEGGLTLSVIGSLLSPGLSVAPVAGDPARLRLSGSPRQGGWSYVYARAVDGDGDAAWQVFSVYATGGPGVLLEADLRGSFLGAASLPWTQYHYLDSAAITWSGLQRGAPNVAGGGTATGSDGTGVSVFAATDAIRFSVSQGAATADVSTLASAISDNEHWAFTITPKAGTPLDLRNAELRFTWVRSEYHAPRFFAIFTSVGGFAAGQQIFTLPSTPGEDAVTEQVLRLPGTAAYQALTVPVEFRLYFYGSQYAHKAEIRGLRLARDTGDPFTARAVRADMPGRDGLAALLVDDPATLADLPASFAVDPWLDAVLGFSAAPSAPQ